MFTSLLASLLLVLCSGRGWAFFAFSPGSINRSIRSWSSLRQSSDGSDEWDQKMSQSFRIQDQIRSIPIVKAVLSVNTDLVPLELVGKTQLPTSKNTNNTQLCLVLTQEPSETATPSLVVPLVNEAFLKPIDTAFVQEPLSNPTLLRLNSIVVNRDDSLWDNLPWATWTIDPEERNRDASGNSIDPKFHLGKRDAYNVMMGKDWTYKSSSQAVSLLTKQLQDGKNDSVETYQNSIDDNSDRVVLAQRLLELQIREMEMDVADLDYQIAVASKSGESGLVATKEFEKEEILAGIDSMKEELNEILISAGKSADAQKSKSGFVDRVLALIERKRKPAPYRGATGYAPFSANQSVQGKVFFSPYDMITDIIENQLNARVVGCVLENTSLLDSTALGGAIVLQRRVSEKTVSIAGGQFTVQDEEEDMGNQGLSGGSTILVECDVDEAVGLSLANKLPLLVEREVFQRSSIMAESASALEATEKLPSWHVTDKEISILVEGQSRNESATERLSPLRIPRTTVSLFDSMFGRSNSPNSNDAKELFPTDNPVRTLEDLDSMSNPDKVRTLLNMSNFQGRLPRPRTIRQASADKNLPNPLDELLLPLIDESVRRKYLIRDAEEKGDTKLARELKEGRSSRQIAQDAAEQARERGDTSAAERLESEAELLETLRADVTQDEGSYSRFLDRDDWYERERQKHAKKIDKKKFGTLLDGIE